MQRPVMLLAVLAAVLVVQVVLANVLSIRLAFRDLEPPQIIQAPGIRPGSPLAASQAPVLIPAPRVNETERDEPETAPPVKIGAHVRHFDGKPSSTALGTWPTFLGPQLNGISHEGISLLERFPEDQPRVIWSVPTGNGYGGAVIHDGRVFVHDYDVGQQAERLRCLSLDDGREIWRRWHTHKVVSYHGYTHTTPAVSADAVVVLGPKNHLMCVDPKSGHLLWGLDLSQRFGTPVDFRVQSPFIDGSTLVLAVGGAHELLVGLDLRSGRLLWSTPNPAKLQLSFSSVVPMIWNARKTYVYRARGGIVGISAEPSTVGTLLWFEPCAITNEAVISPPLILNDGRLFLTYNYGGGAKMIRPTGGGLVQTLWSTHVRDGLSSNVHLPLLMDDHVFAVCAADGGSLKNQLVCMNPDDQGKIVWASGKTHRFSNYAPFLLADGKFFVLDDSGDLTIIRVRVDRYEELSRTKLGKGDWSPAMALVAGRLVIREQSRLFCVDLRD